MPFTLLYLSADQSQPLEPIFGVFLFRPLSRKEFYMSDVITKCIPANPLDNGGLLVGAPRSDDQLGSNYQINTYSSSSPSTGIVFNKYDPRFTGIAPCVNTCQSAGEVIGNGVCAVLFV